MFLSTLTISNFRGIRSANILFDDTTVFIGENDSGKTSLFEALSIALTGTECGPPVFSPQHFHRNQGDLSQTPIGDIRIELVFDELKNGAWNQLPLNLLAPLLPVESKEPRKLCLRLMAKPDGSDATVTADWLIYGPPDKQLKNNLEALTELRRLNPLIWLHGNTLLGAGAGNQFVMHPEPEPDIAPLVREIEKHYQALIKGDSRQTHDEIEAGYKAARTLLARRATDIVSAGSLTHPLIADVLGTKSDNEQKLLHIHHGSAALQTGVFILTASLLSYFNKEVTPGIEPILMLEDPEANLHLMTLASVWGLLKHVKAQKMITTQSGTLLAAAPLHKIRRLTRYRGELKQWYVRKNKLSHEVRRKLSYHVRVRRGSASFARCWLLVEGETEFWVLPELALINGYDFNIEGIAVVEFAQCGLEPLITLAREWGIEWHVLCDGDKAGREYAETAGRYAQEDDRLHRITRLRDADIEHCFWSHGYKHVFAGAAERRLSTTHLASSTSIINRAIKRHSKPYLAFEIIKAAAEENSPGVPAELDRMINTCIKLARNAPERENNK